MPEIQEKTEATILNLEQENSNLEIDKFSLQQQSLRLQAINLLTIFLIAGSLIIQAFAILELNQLDREKNALNLITKSSEVFNQKKSIDTLNFLEIVALSYKNNVADKSIIESYFKQSAIDKVTELEEFIQEVDQDNGHKNWEEIRNLVKQWQK